MEKKTLWEWFKSQPLWLQIIIALAAAIAAIFGVGSAQSCTVTHKVVQSAYNTSTGDSIIIRYEQTGKGFKGM